MKLVTRPLDWSRYPQSTVLPSVSVAAQPLPAMSEPHMPSFSSMIPQLTADNFLKWQMCVKAYLTPGDHVRVVEQVRTTGGAYVDPSPPVDPADLALWNQSERLARGAIMASAYKLHLELIYRHERLSVWELWVAIEGSHVQQDASVRYAAWMSLLGVRKLADENYTEYLNKLTDAKYRIDRVTPARMTHDEKMNEIVLFAAMCGLPTDDPMRRQLVAQKNVSLADAKSAFLRVDQDSKVVAAVESANAAASGLCFTCQLPGHLSKDCPHRDAIKNLVARHAGTGNASGRFVYIKGKKVWKAYRNNGSTNGKGNPSTPASGTGASGTNAALVPSITNTSSASAAVESAGVATSFLLHTSHTSDWLCGSGASSSMSGDRSIFLGLRKDWRAIHLANGSVIYSEGLGSVHFLSDSNYFIVINDVLFVPSLASGLFASNRFAQEHRDDYSEVLDFPVRRWVNRRTGVTEFTATIRSNDLAYLDWRPAPRVESAHVTIAELDAQLNHLPHLAVRLLVREKAILGLPEHIAGLTGDVFCKDCVNGKLTRAPHTTLAARAERLLLHVFSDVHGPLPVNSCRGHLYWVTFIDDYSRFPSVYFISKKSGVFDAFRKYKAWVENLTGHKIGILRDDKGGEYTGTTFDAFLRGSGIRREHSIHDTPQQLSVVELMNRSIDEGVTTLLSQSGLAREWWEDTAMHWLYGKTRIPSSKRGSLTPLELFTKRKPDVSRLRPFGCLVYVHLQKDQRLASSRASRVPVRACWLPSRL